MMIRYGALSETGLQSWTAAISVARMVHALAMMAEVWRTRRILAELDPRLLKDIGVSRATAQREAARAPWDMGRRG